jgi:hypothetical protein
MSRPRRVLGIAAVAALAVAGAGIGWALSRRAGRRRGEVAAPGLPGIVVHGSGVVIATGGSVVQQGVGGKGVASTGSTAGGTSSVGCAPERDGAVWTLDTAVPAGPVLPAVPLRPAALVRPAAAALPAGRTRPWSGLLPARPVLPTGPALPTGPVPPTSSVPPTGPVLPAAGFPPDPGPLDPAAARRAWVSHPSRTVVPAPRPALGPGRYPGWPEVLRAADRWARLPWWSGAGAERAAGGPAGSALLDAGLEDHSVLVCGDGNLVGADDSAIVVDRDGSVVVSTGDVDSAGVSLVDAVATVVDASGSGEEADADEAAASGAAAGSAGPGRRDVEARGEGTGAGSGARGSGASGSGRARSAVGAAADGVGGAGAAVIGPDVEGGGPDLGAAADGGGEDEGSEGDGVDDVSLRVLGSRNVVVQDDGVVVVGGTGPVSAQIGDSDTGGVLGLRTVGTRVGTDTCE